MTKYDHQALESKWRKIWEELDLYRTPEDATRENKQYVLPQLPYPSGAGLHVGHAEGYTACDIYARYLRMQGKKVLQVIGWDSFGLPAENFAIKTNVHPRINTDQAIDNFREQIKSLGLSVDWSREVGSHNPDYYKWTQWFFLLMYERGLAYRKKQAVNWCDTDKTVLANEQVVNGKCERCGSDVEQREMEQWFLKITDYADRLYKDLDKVDWPAESVKRQRDWIGLSEGALVNFVVKDTDKHLEIFTTRPDTIFGATFMVIAPEHQLISDMKSQIQNWNQIQKYVDAAAHKSELERQKQKEKTGVKLDGVVAINPASGEEIPIYVSDYVLITYGTGAIMAVPAHDDRDLEFADKFDLDVRTVIIPELEHQKYVMILPKALLADWKPTQKFIKGLKLHQNEHGLWQGLELIEGTQQVAIVSADPAATVDIQKHFLEQILDTASAEVTLISKGKILHMPAEEWITFLRQAHTDGKEPEGLEDKYALVASQLWAKGGDYQTFLESPLIKESLFTTGEGYLVNSGEFNDKTTADARQGITQWLEKQGLGKAHKTFKLRDWSVSRQRFWGAPVPMVYDPEGNIHPVKFEDLPVILPDDVDFKPTGQSPLTYSPSFQGKVEEIYGAGWKREVDTLDTFMCSSWYYYRYLDPKNEEAFASPEVLKTWMPVDFYIGGPEHVNGHLLYSRFFTKVLFDAGYIDFDEPFLLHRHQGTIAGPDGRKMSKRYGNVINPTDVVAQHGADTVRIYEMFMGPLDQDKAWNPEAATGVRRFLQRIHDFNTNFVKAEAGEMSAHLHPIIKKIGEDIPALRFNIAVSELMKLLNTFEADVAKVSRTDWETFLKLLSPFGPFLAEELWSQLGYKESIHLETWPKYDESQIKSSGFKVAVQVNGKVRDTLMLQDEASEDAVLELAKANEKVAKHLEGKQIKNKVYVPGRVLNIITD